MIITIDGKSGLGKSTIAEKLATARHMHHINSGKMYRYITWRALQLDQNLETVSVCRIADEMDILAANNMGNTLLRSPEVTANVNKISKITAVRKRVNSAIVSQTRNGDFVLDGRDMCYVLPDANIKFVFDAPIEDRIWLATEILGKPYLKAMELIAMRDRDEPSFDYPEDVIYLNPIESLRSDSSNSLDTIMKISLDTIMKIIDQKRLKSSLSG